MISFIISAYNRPDDLRVTLASLIAQTSPAWECFVMDEGDNAGVVRQMADARIKRVPVVRRIVTTDGRGSLGYFAKHMGVSRVNGSHIAFSSDDLYYLPQFVEKMDGHLEDIIGCDMFINYQRGINCLRFAPKVTFCDCANYVIRPATYRRHPFSEFIPDGVVENDSPAAAALGTADGLCVQKCVEDGASVKYVSKFLVMHGSERP